MRCFQVIFDKGGTSGKKIYYNIFSLIVACPRINKETLLRKHYEKCFPVCVILQHFFPFVGASNNCSGHKKQSFLIFPWTTFPRLICGKALLIKLFILIQLPFRDLTSNHYSISVVPGRRPKRFLFSDERVIFVVPFRYRPLGSHSAEAYLGEGQMTETLTKI